MLSNTLSLENHNYNSISVRGVWSRLVWVKTMRRIEWARKRERERPERERVPSMTEICAPRLSRGLTRAPAHDQPQTRTESSSGLTGYGIVFQLTDTCTCTCTLCCCAVHPSCCFLSHCHMYRRACFRATSRSSWRSPFIYRYRFYRCSAAFDVDTNMASER